MHSWLLFSIGGPLLWALSNVLDGVLRRHYVKNDFMAMWLTIPIRLPIIIALAFFINLTPPGLVPTLIMIAAGCLWNAPFFLYYKAIEFEEPSRVTFFIQMTPVFGTVLAFLILGESLTTAQTVAFFFLLSGAFLAAAKKVATQWRMSSALWMIAVAAFFWALSDVAFKKAAPSFTSFWSAFAWYMIGGLIFALITFITPRCFKKIKTHILQIPKKALPLMLINYTAGFLGTVSFNYALLLGKVGLTSVLIGLQPFFVIIYTLILGRFISEIKQEDFSKQTLLFKGAALIFIIIGLRLLYL